ncbi:aminotransferase family protein [Micromonospora sp. NBC_01813]|uniref:aminotransferase family protein n=1 Tax=Micromonospora sp. NBC_01813 TaxID=2975988 RepID=UPI002DDB6E0A|nr:aminotransferase class III-fold pyridoxal phosphate-dependent enzyme [Micromonospora sp. NBC_01813]WSA10043.1 aminotransferase class III-fold pyridoxal phosphate-dependent enzyme [Micromonospora sp. NBC_01813]
MTTTQSGPSRSTVANRTTIASRLWHPFSSLHDTLASEISIVEGKGAQVRDSDGNWYLDATAGLWYANVGHGQLSIATAIAEQAGRLAAYSTFGNLVNPAAAELAERLAELAPMPDPMVFLTSGGSDAVDTAVKIARRYWTLRGEPDRSIVISRESSYHGMHGHGTSLAGIAANAAGYGNTTAPGFVRVPHDDAGALRRAIERLGAEQVAAFFVEPIIGAGGVHPPVSGYLREVAGICRQHGVLLVVDEVVTGFGRTADWFASVSYGLEPDLLLFAKGVTSGYVPLGGVIAARGVWEVFADAAAGMFRHGYTYSGHAVACAAATANLRLLVEHELLDRVAVLADDLATGLSALTVLPGVREVRTAGLLAAVALRTAEDPTLPDRVVRHARAAGVLTRVINGDSLQISPAFVLTDEELGQLVERLGEAIDQAVSDQ